MFETAVRLRADSDMHRTSVLYRRSAYATWWHKRDLSCFTFHFSSFFVSYLKVLDTY